MRKSNKLFKVTCHILYLIPILSLYFFFYNTSALEYDSSTNIQFTFNPTISMNLSSSDLVIPNLSPGSYADSNIITINVATNNVTGYTLTATVGNSTNPSHNTTSLTNISNSNYQFTSLSSPVSTLDTLSNNTWGYNYSNDNGTTWHNYAALPLYSDTSSPSATLSSPTIASNDSIKFKIGAKADSTQATGTYTNTVNFYAVAKQTPVSISDAYLVASQTNPNITKHNGYYTMQDMSSTICSMVEIYDEDSQTQLIDVRDGKIYWVAKLRDEHCWMTQNLDLAGGTEIEYTKSDVPENYILPTENNFQSDNKLPESTTAGFGDNAKAFVYNSNNPTNNCFASGCYSYYSWVAATAGSALDVPTNNLAKYSICSKNWRLPTAGDDFRKLATLVGGSISVAEYTGSTIPTGSEIYNTLLLPPYNLINSGKYYNDSFAGGTGYWSSSTTSSVSAQYLDITRTYVHFSDTAGRRYGFSVRCIAK